LSTAAARQGSALLDLAATTQFLSNFIFFLWFSPAPRVYAPVSTRIDFCRRGICFLLPSTSVLIFPLYFFRSASGFGRSHTGSAAGLIFPLSW
jgi:hypothetical protein